MTEGVGHSGAFRDSFDVRALGTPSRTEIDQLAPIFDQYRNHYGEAGNASQAASWLDANLRSGRLDAFVAVENGEFIGFAITMAVPASLRLGHFWQIRDLFVVEHRRQLGVGGALLAFVRSAAFSAGASRVTLQTEVDNASAVRLYERNGYSIVEGYCSLTLALDPDLQGS